MSTRKWSIRAALRANLLEVDNLPDVNWENQNFEPTDGATYLRETMLPADETLTENNGRTAIGIYQIDVFTPIGSSIKTAEDLADSIKEQFKPAQTVGGVQLERSVVLQGRRDGAWYMIPVRADYKAFSTNT